MPVASGAVATGGLSDLGPPQTAHDLPVLDEVELTNGNLFPENSQLMQEIDG